MSKQKNIDLINDCSNKMISEIYMLANIIDESRYNIIKKGKVEPVDFDKKLQEKLNLTKGETLLIYALSNLLKGNKTQVRKNVLDYINSTW